MLKGGKNLTQEKREKSKDLDMSFEESLDRLEKIVNELEGADLPLDRSIELYEEGIALVKRCTSSLEKAEMKIKVLACKNGEIVEEDFIGRENE